MNSRHAHPIRRYVTLSAMAIVWWRPALAHSGAPPAPHDLWQLWNGDPLLMLLLLAAVALYGRGLSALWQRAGVGRGVRRWQVGCFGGGILALILALISPIDAVGSALFAVHMLQHLLLMAVAAPLLILGTPPLLSYWILPRAWRRPVAQWWQQRTQLRRLLHWTLQPLVAWSLYGSTLWIWHAPILYEAALRNEALHILEHATFLGVSLLFWWIIIYRHQSRVRVEMALLLLFTTALHSGLLGALITFASRPLYTHYISTAPRWGLTALTDQQLAGTLMWIPVGFLYLGTIVLLMGQWLNGMSSEKNLSESKAISVK